MLTIDLGTSTTFVSSISVMSGRPAPPGRRGSVKKESFKSDDDAPAIPVLAVEQLSAADRLKSEREEEMKRAMELRKKAIEDEALAEKQEKEARKTALAQERALEAQRADQQKQAELQSQQREQAAQKAALELKQKNLEEENARLAQIERSRVLAEEEKRQAAQRAEEARIQSETIRREAEVATKVAPKPVVEEQHDDVEFEREQERQRQALEDARKKRELAEAQRQADQLEVTRKQQQLEEQQRRMDEKLAKQKELLAETAAAELHAQEEARRKQDERRRQLESAQREQVAAQKAAEQAEIDRLRSEEEDRQRQALAALQREQEEHDAEVLRMEQERAAAAAEALRAEQAISQFENAALDEKRRRAEAQRQKRAMFLNEMDSFSTTFEAKTQVQEDSIKQEQEKHYELLGQQMKQVEDAKAELLAKEAAEKEQRRRAALATAQAALAVPVPLPAPAASKASADTYSIQLDAESTSRNLLGDLSSTLFTSASTSDALPMDTHTGEGSGESALAMEGDEEEAAGDSQELRVPTRIGSGKPKAKGPFKPAPVAVINAKATAAIQRYSEDEEEEGTGGVDSISNVLTLEERRKMTLAQKETWRAKQADLTEKRRDFHGVVTYTFDGVFSWQMYGSAEAVDETGSNYTEYLMRCQWGTTFENMQPWIVAHRYKEFDALDQSLKRKFPRLEANMPKLPKKDLFRALNSDVVAERRAILEEYMSKIVSSMPSLLRSELVNDFLDITNRISAIRLMLLKASNARVQAESNGTPLPADISAAGKGTIATPPPVVKTTGVSSNSKYGIEDPLARRTNLSPIAGQSAGAEHFAGDVEDEPLYWNMDDAEEARAAKNARSLDEDQLGLLEIDVRSLGQLLRKGDNKALVAKDSKFRAKYKTVSKRWPNLRATAVVGMGVDFTLIPRAMQVEEDLVRFVNEFRNIETASSLSARMTAV